MKRSGGRRLPSEVLREEGWHARCFGPEPSTTRFSHHKDLGERHPQYTCGSQWVDPGVVALDACYGDVSATVRRTGEVNGWVAGTYTVSYAVTDSGGNSAAPVTRTVQVVNCPW